MKSKVLSPMDAAFLAMESKRTPMHVGGLMVFRAPTADAGFLRSLFADLRASRVFRAPWNRQIESLLPPTWKEARQVDVEYHVRHWALPDPGGERELGQLIARLHSIPIDLSRPPWEFHLIEGLERDRFAIYVKLHHAMADGVSGARLLLRSLSEDPTVQQAEPFWSNPGLRRSIDRTRKPDAEPWIDSVLRQLQGLPQAGASLLEAGDAVRDSMASVMGPLKAPPSLLNSRVRGQRRFATQQYRLERLKKIAAAANCSVNDVVLCICASALRRFLVERQALPEASLTAGVPVSIRRDGDDSVGNAVSMIVVSLATHIVDPVERLGAISQSTRTGKARLDRLSAGAVTPYTLLMMAPYAMQLITGIGASTRPIFNLVVSNLPGPSQPLYLRGAPLEAMYPVSVVTHGQALNITCLSYNGSLNFGFTACRDSLPSMQNIAVYCGEALVELEEALAAQAAA